MLSHVFASLITMNIQLLLINGKSVRDDGGEKANMGAFWAANNVVAVLPVPPLPQTLDTRLYSLSLSAPASRTGNLYQICVWISQGGSEPSQTLILSSPATSAFHMYLVSLE